MRIWANYICIGRMHGWTLHVRESLDIHPNQRVRILLRPRSNFFPPLFSAPLKCYARVSLSLSFSNSFPHCFSERNLAEDRNTFAFASRIFFIASKTVAESFESTLRANLRTRPTSPRSQMGETNRIDVPLKFTGTLPLSR